MIRVPLARLPFALAVAASLAACSGQPAPDRSGDQASPPAQETPAARSSEAPPPAEVASSEPATDDPCGANKVAPWIGKGSTVPVRSAVAKAAGAESDRWLYPDSVVTQDYSPARLNVVMEKGTNRIVSAHCG